MAFLVGVPHRCPTSLLSSLLSSQYCRVVIISYSDSCCCIMYRHCCNQFICSNPSCCLRSFSLFSSLGCYNLFLLLHADLICCRLLSVSLSLSIRCFSLFSSLGCYNLSLLLHADLICCRLLSVSLSLSIVGGRFPMVVAWTYCCLHRPEKSPTRQKKPTRHQLLTHDEINEKSVMEYEREAPLNS